MKKKSFTLVEIMIVVAIIAILAAIAVPSLSKNRETAADQTKIANVKVVEGAIASYLAANPSEVRSDVSGLGDLTDYLDQDADDLKVAGVNITVNATEVTYK